MSMRSEDVLMGAIIRRYRLSWGLTQEALGEAAGAISYQQIQKYETGVNRVSVSRLIDIAKALGTTAATLVADLEAELAAEPMREAA